jgi:hypothetical protein
MLYFAGLLRSDKRKILPPLIIIGIWIAQLNRVSPPTRSKIYCLTNWILDHGLSPHQCSKDPIDWNLDLDRGVSRSKISPFGTFPAPFQSKI